MLKKLGGAVLVTALAFAGMAGAAKLALHLTRPEVGAAEPRVAESKSAVAVAAKPKKAREPAKPAKPRGPHPWDEACSTAYTEAQALLLTSSAATPADVLELLREGVGINVRLFQTLHSTGDAGVAGRAFLSQLERSISIDNDALRRLERTMSPEVVAAWTKRNREINAGLHLVAKRMGAADCARYFGA